MTHLFCPHFGGKSSTEHHSASGFPPRSDEKIYANLRDCFISVSLKYDDVLDVAIANAPRADGGVVCEEVDAQGVGVRVDEACCSLDEFVVSALGEECLECGLPSLKIL